MCRLSCGTTWHAAGLLGASRATRAHTKITTYSNELYAKLEEETGLGTGTLVAASVVIKHKSLYHNTSIVYQKFWPLGDFAEITKI